MSEPYLGQIEAFPFNFVPKNWLACQGQLLPIAQYAALFALLGTTYGGDGRSNFALPDLRGRLAMGQGTGAGLSPCILGQQIGEENHTILLTETPMHVHAFNTAANGPTSENQDAPNPTVALASATQVNAGVTTPLALYAPLAGAQTGTLASSAISMTTGGQPHSNMMPYLTLQFCIATAGIFPSRN